MSQSASNYLSEPQGGGAPPIPPVHDKALLKEGRASNDWGKNQKIFFRLVFIYFILIIVPTDPLFYQKLFSLSLTDLHVYDLLNLSTYTPYWGLPPFYSWLSALLIAAIGATVWTTQDNNRTREYNNLYYWLRVLLRYRLAIGVISYGLIKLFPIQIPFPSLSGLHTTYGQFLPWKIYYSTVGIVPWYESFLGAVEVIAGLLLFHRSTTTFGAGILVGFTGNVLAANFAYDFGDQVYSTYLFLIAVFLLANDVPRLYSLLIEQRFTLSEKFVPFFTQNVQKARLVLKSLFVLFLLLFGIKSYSNYRHGPYLIPRTAGLKGSYGYYNVKEFKLNQRAIPYSLTDPDRWQNVVFEKWATISVRIATPIKVDQTRDHSYYDRDIDRSYEEAGMGERRYYTYTADTVAHTLLLRNKNPNYKADSLRLQYKWEDGSTLVLTGTNERKDSIDVRLERVVKDYLFYEGRRKPIKM